MAIGNSSSPCANGTGFDAAPNIKVGAAIHSLSVADFNRDGHPDLVGGSTDFPSATVHVLFGDGGGNFGTATFAVPPFVQSVAVADFNGDGNEDVVAGMGNTSGATVAVLLGNGGGGLSAPEFFSPGGFNSKVATGDFNGDGHADVVSGDLGVGERPQFHRARPAVSGRSRRGGSPAPAVRTGDRGSCFSKEPISDCFCSGRGRACRL